MQITNHLYFYREVPSRSFITSNSYVVIDDTVMMIDPGHWKNLENLLRNIRDDGLDPREIELIANTHSHMDHCSANRDLKSRVGAKIAMHKLDAEFLSVAEDIAKIFGDTLPKFTVDLFLGEDLRTGSRTFKIIHTPGHTPGGVCLYEPRTRILFSGDTIFAGGTIGRTDFKGGDPKQLAESIAKLATLDVEILCAGHSDVTMVNVRKQIMASLNFAKMMVAQ